MLKIRGFVMVLAIVFIMVLTPLVWVLINIGMSETVGSSKNVDILRAYYLAASGAEWMYARLKTMETKTVTWPQATQTGDVTINGVRVGTYTVSADALSSNIFAIVSEGRVTDAAGTVLSRASLHVKYRFTSSSDLVGLPLGASGDMQLYGSSIFGFKSWVRVEGPVWAGGGFDINDYVKITGEAAGNQTIPQVSFWLGARFDTNNDSVYAADLNSDGIVTWAEAEAQGTAYEEAFNNDDIYNHDGVNPATNVIDNNDAMYYYYTTYLNNLMGLQIGPGEANYYSGDLALYPGSVSDSVQVIFATGNIDITLNDQDWADGAMDHTIIAMNDITIVQPTNGQDDRLTLVAGGDVYTGGVRAFGGVRGELIIYAADDFIAYYGGRINGSILAGDDVIVDTVLPIPGLLNRDINRSQIDWSDPDEWPVGLPPGYCRVSTNFSISGEHTPQEFGGYPPVWHRH